MTCDVEDPLRGSRVIMSKYYDGSSFKKLSEALKRLVSPRRPRVCPRAASTTKTTRRDVILRSDSHSHEGDSQRLNVHTHTHMKCKYIFENSIVYYQ